MFDRVSNMPLVSLNKTHLIIVYFLLRIGIFPLLVVLTNASSCSSWYIKMNRINIHLLPQQNLYFLMEEENDKIFKGDLL